MKSLFLNKALVSQETTIWKIHGNCDAVYGQFPFKKSFHAYVIIDSDQNLNNRKAK